MQAVQKLGADALGWNGYRQMISVDGETSRFVKLHCEISVEKAVNIASMISIVMSGCRWP